MWRWVRDREASLFVANSLIILYNGRETRDHISTSRVQKSYVNITFWVHQLKMKAWFSSRPSSNKLPKNQQVRRNFYALEYHFVQSHVTGSLVRPEFGRWCPTDFGHMWQMVQKKEIRSQHHYCYQFVQEGDRGQVGFGWRKISIHQWLWLMGTRDKPWIVQVQP